MSQTRTTRQVHKSIGFDLLCCSPAYAKPRLADSVRMTLALRYCITATSLAASAAQFERNRAEAACRRTQLTRWLTYEIERDCLAAAAAATHTRRRLCAGRVDGGALTAPRAIGGGRRRPRRRATTVVGRSNQVALNVLRETHNASGQCKWMTCIDGARRAPIGVNTRHSTTQLLRRTLHLFHPLSRLAEAPGHSLTDAVMAGVQNLQQDYLQIPPITRMYSTACVLTTLAVVCCDLFDVLLIALNVALVDRLLRAAIRPGLAVPAVLQSDAYFQALSGKLALMDVVFV